MPSILQEFKNGNKCPHCNHTDWCYSVGDLTVCNRGAEPAPSWFATSKSDKAGVPYYAPVLNKAPRPIGRQEFIYTDNSNNPLIKVVIVRKSEFSKDVYQEYWNGIGWAPAKSMSSEMKRALQQQVSWYRYNDLLQAVVEGKPIFIVEGEGVADALWDLGLAATTTIGGAGKYRSYGNYKEDLSGADIVLCPDRDEPGVKHMEEISKDFPGAKWLYAPPSEFYWSKLPKSGGLDIKDWINDGASVSEIMAAIGNKLEAETFSPAGKLPVKPVNDVTSNTERLRLELLDLVQETDSVARILKRSQICSRYKITKTELEALIQETQYKLQPRRLKAYTFDELLELESESLDWLIPELLPRGELVVLGGAPKCGKTLMAIDAAFAIATGEDVFLGLKCGRGKVLVISNDETVRSTKAKLVRRGFRLGDGENLMVVSEWKINQLYELEKTMEEFKPDLVIVDSLKSISTNSEISENSAEFANIIYNFKTVLNRFKCAGILIHHTNKNKEAMGVAKLRGSSSIVAATWGAWILDQIPKQSPDGGKGLVIEPNDPARLLSVFARDIEGQLLKLEFNGENNSYGRTDMELIREQDKLRDRILAVLRLNKQGLSGREIIELMGMTKEEGRPVYNELNRMEARRLISTISSNRDRRVTLYTITTDGEVVIEQQDSPPTQNDENAPKNLETPKEQEFQDSHQEEKNSHQESQEPQEINETSDFSLLEVEMDGDVTGFIGCHVEVRKIDGAVKLEGELTGYDSLNGSVTIKTTEGAIHTAHVRETFVI
ncbi:hypothetical protein DSM106972_094490 [Dulcicalothrix desertica PCC 7102]|uniref:AAA+ ATPase domain-containing protein n=1 Tax=Dulcicalothrix desertica PCC 7102 TaxID=232991 RepID=A0A433UJF9_9CYAN|nr:AAA family ATPase [Dulcicalothrix desertica]RUS93978.1 hypothetical protein DSM106972_094490 [Dulcicalothrix desertica PCC 7102]TWH62661.1 AAA domain-containing protein [Dulcicalothrix desertica PCC 7102]